MESGTSQATSRRRRQFYRVDCEQEVPFRIDSNGAEGRATLVNLGLGGARIDLPETVRLPALVELSVETTDAMGKPDGEPPLSLTGRVVWTVADAEGGPYPTGLQFMEMDDDVRRRLHAYVGCLMA